MLFPGYFALVMATAAVSIASFLLNHILVARILVGLNWVFYLALWALTFVRLTRFPQRLVDDLRLGEWRHGVASVYRR